MNFRPGIHRHWKGGFYRALFLAQDSTNRITDADHPYTREPGSTEEPLVIYVSLDLGEHAGNVCARTLSQWNEMVAGSAGPHPRFEWMRP